MKFLKCLFIMLSVTLPVTASAKLSSADAAQAAYTKALTQLIAGKQQLREGKAISFQEVYEGQSGNKRSVARVLRLSKSGEEILTPKVDANSGGEGELNWQSSVLVKPDRFPVKAVSISETETSWVFRIPTQISASADDEQELDSDKVNSKLTSALVSELTVSKKSPQFLTLKIYAQEPFKPEPLVEVSEFNVRMEFTQAWSNGPLVTKSISRIVKGKYAFFVSVDEFSSKTYQEFRLVK